MNERRLIDIEVKLAHHEHTIADLNQALADQQKQLTRLQGVCDTLIAKLTALFKAGSDPSAGAAGD